jgi:NADPH:quinone reductase
VVGVFWGEFARREPKANAAMMQTLAQWYAQGRIKPLVAETLPMSALKTAYARMAAREVVGKLVLICGDQTQIQVNTSE